MASAGYRSRAALPGAGFLLFEAMRGRDVRAVAAIERQSFRTAYPPRVFRRELATRDSFWWVVRLVAPQGPAPVVAYVGYLRYGDDGAHIAKIATDPRWRRRRLGGWLLLNMLIAAHRDGAAYVTLEVRDGNTAARQFYRTWGFVQVQRSRGHYDDTGEDGLILAYPALAEPDVEARLGERLRRIAVQAP